MADVAERCSECNAALPPAGAARFCPMCGQALAGAPAGAEALRPAAAGGGPAQRSAWIEFLDSGWDFFASTRVAMVLILLIAAAAIGGSLVEQESLYQDWRPPELYYPFRYGEFWGPLFMKVGLTHTFSSVWFVGLVYAIVVSLIICSLQRLVPLHRALQRPTVRKHAGFIRRQPSGGEYPQPGGGDALAPAEQWLRRRGYRIWRDGEGLHADRGRLGRYGPYIIHIGLIMCAFAAAAKALPGWDITRDMWVPEGQTVVIPGTSLAIRNDAFTIEMYPDGRPRLYQTDAVLLEDGQEIRQHAIRVNYPLKHKGWEVYQASYKPEPGTVHLKVVAAATGEELGRVAADLKTPLPQWDLPGGRRAVVEEYYHDAEIDAATQTIVNKSRDILNPLFFLRFEEADGTAIGAQALWVSVRPGQTLPVIGNGQVRLEQVDLDLRWYSGLKAHHDRTVPFMFTGLGVVLLGMWITFFVFHRQVWVLAVGDQVLLGARTNKDRWGQEREIKRLLEGLGGRLTAGYAAADPDEAGPAPAAGPADQLPRSAGVQAD